MSSAEIIQSVRRGLPKKDQSAVLSEETRLRPLGHPSQGCEKFFLECHISGLEDDPVWLHKTLLTIRLTFPHYRMSSLREIGGASRSILGPYAN